MYVSKDSIEYKGRDYPCVEVSLTRDEGARHYVSRFYMFADEELLHDMEDAEGVEADLFKGRAKDIDCAIDYYMDGQTCERYCAGEIPDEVMKVKAARKILEWA